MSLVHVHGTEDGPGLLCPERRDADGLVGACQPERFERACPDDPEDEGVPLSVVVDRLRDLADELDDVLTAVADLRRSGWFGGAAMARLSDRVGQAWAHVTQAHQQAQRLAAADPERAVREP